VQRRRDGNESQKKLYRLAACLNADAASVVDHFVEGWVAWCGCYCNDCFYIVCVCSGNGAAALEVAREYWGNQLVGNRRVWHTKTGLHVIAPNALEHLWKISLANRIHHGGWWGAARDRKSFKEAKGYVKLERQGDITWRVFRMLRSGLGGQAKPAPAKREMLGGAAAGHAPWSARATSAVSMQGVTAKDAPCVQGKRMRGR
jgi:hypothetical protein